ncbi:MAG: hypothetical protein ABSB82_06435 [Terriglobia bacterium]
MNSLLPRRILPAIAMAFAIIVLTPTPVLADTWMPFLWEVAPPIFLLAFIPVVAIESYVLLKALRLSKRRSVRVSIIANAVSTAVGIPLAMALGSSLLTAHFYRGKFSFSVHWFGQMPPLVSFHVPNWAMPVAMAILLIPLFLVSWWVEYFVARLLLRGEQAARGVGRAEFKANLASYALPLILMIGVGILMGSFEPTYPTQASAVGSLRTINTSEVTYSSTYTLGFGPTLAALGGPSDCREPGEQHACLIDSQLTAGEKNGYRFVYAPIYVHGDEIDGYSVDADPIQSGPGNNHYHIDEGGYATVRSPAPQNCQGVIFNFHREQDVSQIPRHATFSCNGWGPDVSHAVPIVRALGTIYRAEQTYSQRYGRGPAYSTVHGGFSQSLVALGGPRNCSTPSSDEACLIDRELARGRKYGYHFIYKPHHPQPGTIVGYSVTASPVQGAGHGNFYYTDQSGVIRYNATRPATAEDPPLAG